jgi:hypothetical protein
MSLCIEGSGRQLEAILPAAPVAPAILRVFGQGAEDGLK